MRVLKGVTAPEDVSIWIGTLDAGGRIPLELRSGRDQVHVRATARYFEIHQALTERTLGPISRRRRGG